MRAGWQTARVVELTKLIAGTRAALGVEVDRQRQYGMGDQGDEARIIEQLRELST